MERAAFFGVVGVVLFVAIEGAAGRLSFGPTLNEGEEMRLALDANGGGASVDVAVCNTTCCYGFQVTGYSKGAIAGRTLWTYQVNNVFSDLSNFNTLQVYSGPSWTKGKSKLVIQRIFGMLGLWGEEEEDSDSTMWIPCPPDVNIVMVRSENSNIVRAELQSADGSESYPLGWPIRKGELMTVKFKSTDSRRSYLDIGLCGQTACAVARIGALLDPEDPITACTGIAYVNEPRMIQTVYMRACVFNYWQDSSSLELSVALHPAGFLQVWKANDQANVISVPVLRSLLKESIALKVQNSFGMLTIDSQGTRTIHQLPHPSAYVKTMPKSKEHIDK